MFLWNNVENHFYLILSVALQVDIFSGQQTNVTQQTACNKHDNTVYMYS